MLHRQPRQPKSIEVKTWSEDSKKALTNLALEGIVPSDALLTDIQLLDSGDITREQYKQRAIARALSKS